LSLFRQSGAKTRRLEGYLRRRARTPPPLRPALDCRTWRGLTAKRAVVFTDTADFTERTLRHGILHFLMTFGRVVEVLRPVIRRRRGRLEKVEGDSLLLSYRDVRAACAGVCALEAALRRENARKPEDERYHFSYGIGYGDLVVVEGDLFGLEVNLASKLGEDLARPGEALLSPAATAALDPVTRRRVVPYRTVFFKKTAIEVRRLRLPGPRPRRGRRG
jgi:class 3 adenylate cyclase